VSPIVTEGSIGNAVVGAAVKFNAPVKSPVTPRRHADKFGTCTPNRVSMNRSTEVWSSVPEYLNPPALNGEITSAGVRSPNPMWRERTGAEGFYRGASYHGALQLLAEPTGRRIAGKWVGFGKDHDVNTGPWSLEFLDGSTAPGTIERYSRAPGAE
jgi:hypothetical protein